MTFESHLEIPFCEALSKVTPNKHPLQNGAYPAPLGPMFFPIETRANHIPYRTVWSPAMVEVCFERSASCLDAIALSVEYSAINM